jgi:secondary thiamine-phosphate synthase enzyme
MTVEITELQFESKKEGDIVNLTEEVAEAVEKSGIRSGIVTVFVPGSTGSVTTTEFEPGAFTDLPAALQRIAPREAEYAHHLTWGDDNGRSHVRASILGPSLTVPFTDGRLLLGTWQQIVFIELDTRPRRRRVVVQMLGE